MLKENIVDFCFIWAKMTRKQKKMWRNLSKKMAHLMA